MTVAVAPETDAQKLPALEEEAPKTPTCDHDRPSQAPSDLEKSPEEKAAHQADDPKGVAENESEKSLPPGAQLADRMAIVFVDGGAPDTAENVKFFLKRTFADPRVFDSPLGTFALPLFTAIFRPTAARDLTRALEAVGGKDDLPDQLKKRADEVCRALSQLDGMPGCEPFGACLFSKPSLPRTLDAIMEEDFSQIVAVWPHPFGSSLTKNVSEALLKYASDNPDAPPMALVSKWMNPEKTVALISQMVRQALTALPDNERDQAHVAFILQPLPIETVKDEALFEARRLVADAMKQAEASNDFTVVYLEGLEPAAPMIPDFDDLLRRLKKKKPQLICVPLMSLVEDLSLKGGLMKLAVQSAHQQGFDRITVTPSPFAGPEATQIVADAIVEHLKRSNEFFQEAFVRPKKH